MLHHPCILGVPNAKRGEQNQKWSQTKGNKIRSGCHTLAFSGAQKRAEMLCHPYILGGPQQRGAKSEVVHNKRKQNQKWLPQPRLLGGLEEGGNATSPLHSRGPQCQARGAKSEVVPNKGEQNQKWLPHPCLLRGPKEGGNAMSPLHSRGSPIKGSKIRSGPQQRETKSEVAASPLPSWGPKQGRKCYITPAFSGVPNAKRGEQNQKWPFGIFGVHTR